MKKMNLLWNFNKQCFNTFIYHLYNFLLKAYIIHRIQDFNIILPNIQQHDQHRQLIQNDQQPQELYPNIQRRQNRRNVNVERRNRRQRGHQYNLRPRH